MESQAKRHDPPSSRSGITAAAFAELSNDEPCELIRGEVIVLSPAGWEHGKITCSVTFLLASWVREHQLGEVVAGDTGFHIASEPDTVRGPDVGFVAADALPPGPLPTPFFPGPPTLAVEILSPSDRLSALRKKTRDWLEAGCAEMWIVNPRRREVERHCSLEPPSTLVDSDAIRTDLLPGFEAPVADFFDA